MTKYHVFFKKSCGSAPVEANTNDDSVIYGYVQDFLKCAGAVLEISSAEAKE